jgi:ATP-dependent exoDNAse (exonuclease V) beta subunit
VTNTFTPQDQKIRVRIRESIKETLFVEAGAGTGKTTSLVERVVTLASSGAATLDNTAVITFTEAAAAELRDRIRERLEEAAATALSNDSGQLLRRQRALADLDRSSIQTLHSFALSILQERPLEAGLPPVFDTMDAIASDLAFEKAWTDWVDKALDDQELTGSLSLALSLGLTIRQLRIIALTFHQNYDLLEEAAFADTPMPPATVVHELVEGSAEFERLCQYSKLQDQDRLYNHVQGLLRAAARFSELEAESSPTYPLLQRTMPLSQPGGRQPDWERDLVTSVNACKYLKDWLTDLQASAADELVLARRSALMPVLRALKSFAVDFAQDRKRRGVAGYDDLLVWARDLLRDNIPVRDHFRQRYTHLLIDEAQDTDPIQAEIAMFIAEDAGDNLEPGERPRSWQEITPEQGKLFVVGDPKQSIYRFRRADVTQMLKLQKLMGGDTLRLVQNFRSQRPILNWVNSIFEPWMKEGENQAKYIAVIHRWNAETDHAAGPRVWTLGGLREGNIGEIRNEEAQQIAAQIHGMVTGHWQVLDTDGSKSSGSEQYRDASYSDVCILLPRRTGLRGLELALDEASVPYRLEGNALVFGTQEVRDLVNCLKAVDDPADQIATVAALRSQAFACSDVDLFRFSDAGGKFDFLSATDGFDGVNGLRGPIPDALDVLRQFHQQRLWDSPAALIDHFIRERLLMESAMDHPRTREQWRRYRFMVEQARSFAEAGGNSLRAFLDWVERQTSEGARFTETPVPDSDEDAVRIMTVHGAKGLEFPIVLLTGLNANPRPRVQNVLFDRESGAVEVRIGADDTQFATTGFDTLLANEQQLEADEYVRLMYVAATRARDHLVLSLFRSQRSSGSGAGKMVEILTGNDDLWTAAPDASGQVPETVLKAVDGEKPEGHSLADREQWSSRRAELLERQGRPASVAATGLHRLKPERSANYDDTRDPKKEPETDEPWKRGRGGTSLGRAVHSVLQTIDLATGNGIEETSRAQAAAEGLPARAPEVARLSRVAVDSPTVRRAVAASKYWREVPVAIPVGDGVLEGFIDLLFQEDGGLVVVDYKTDAVDSENLEGYLTRYKLQGGAYALAAQRATGMPVREVVFLFLHAGESRNITDIAALAEEAEKAATDHLQGVTTPLP